MNDVRAMAVPSHCFVLSELLHDKDASGQHTAEQFPLRAFFISAKTSAWPDRAVNCSRWRPHVATSSCLLAY